MPILVRLEECRKRHLDPRIGPALVMIIMIVGLGGVSGWRHVLPRL